MLTQTIQASTPITTVPNLATKKKNQKKILYWYQLAVNGDTEAMYALGQLHLQVNEFQEAFGWFLKGATLNNPKCCCQVGYCYLVGIGVTKDTNKSIEWYTKSVEYGNQDAIFNVNALLTEKHMKTKIGPILACLMLIVGGFIATLALTTGSGCQTTPKPPPPATPIIAPDSAQPTIGSIKTATTQLSNDVGSAATTVQNSGTALGVSTDKINNAATSGKAATPANSNLLTYWNSILSEVSVLYGIKSTDDKVSQQLTDAKGQIDALTTQLAVASSAVATQQAFWTQQDANYKKQLADKDTYYQGQLKIKDDQLAADKSTLNSALTWIDVASIVLIGISVALGIILKVPNLARGGVIAFGVTLGVSVVLAQSIWVIKWVALAIAIIFVVMLIIYVIKNNKAILALVQTRETLLQVCRPEAKTFLLGHGAIGGNLKEDDAKSAIEHFGKYVRKANSTVIDSFPTLTLHP